MTKLPVFEVRKASNNADTDIAVLYQDVGKKALPPKGAYASVVERLRKGQAFTAKTGSQQFVRFGGKGSVENVLFVGLGAAKDLSLEKARIAGANAWAKLTAEKTAIAAVHVDLFDETSGYVRAFAEGMALSCYRFEKYKKPSGEDYQGPTRAQFITSDARLTKELETELDQVIETAKAVNVVRDWSNEPSNFGTPQYYASEAQKLARQYGIKCRILTEADAAKEKMGLFLGVGQGAEREGRIVVLDYVPKGVKKPKTLAFVGKGVTFDSGGISIKPSARMEDMKHDMTGAATLFGATLLAAAWGVPNRIITILAFTENMPDGNAIQPGNVIKSRNGKTVEIINTDAEGRLILADVLDYAQDFKPDAIIDAATLTGAVTIALGKHCCAVLGNDDALMESLKRVGTDLHERIWELPLYDDYFEDLKSDYADMKNSANDSYGGTIRGAVFLKQFIRPGQKWAHLDIAATAYNAGHLPYYPKRGASGSYVRTLARFAAEY